MKITLKNGEELNFLETGVDGVYICERAVFKAPFGKDGCNDWNKSSGKKLLEQWFKEHAPAEIQKQFDIDLPMVEEVFSQKMLNLYESGTKLKSKQFHIFQNSDNRMKEFDGKPILWWTRSAYDGTVSHVWDVSADGGVLLYCAGNTYGFVPVLRKKEVSCHA